MVLVKKKKYPVYIAGIDVGTSNIKAGLFNVEDLFVDHMVTIPYKDGFKESCSEIWDKTRESIIKLLDNIGTSDNIRAIGLSGQMHSTVFYDKHGNEFDNIISWQDNRCSNILERYDGISTIDFINRIIEPSKMDVLGIDKIPCGYMASTLFYLKENDSRFYEKIGHVTLLTDYIRGKLLGKFEKKTDRTNAGSTGMFDIKNYRWSSDLLDILNISIELLPEVYEASDIIGYTCSGINRIFNFKKSIPVICGGGDNQISIFGSGIDFLNTSTHLNIGTGSIISRIINNFKKNKGIETRCYFNKNYIQVGASLGGGDSYKYLKKQVNLSYREMDELASGVPPGSNGLIYKTGPTRLNERARHGFSGSAEEGDATGAKSRAVMEGVLADLLDFYNKIGRENSEFIICSGGGMINSRVWPQIAADMFGKKIKVTKFEGTILGAALLAARSLGLKLSYKDLFDLETRYTEFRPNFKNTEIYNKIKL